MSQFYQGVTAGSLPPVVPTSFVTDLGTVIPAANIVNVNGGNGVQVVANPNGSNNMVINVINDGFPWSDQAVSFNAAAQNGYFCTAALTVSLPASTTTGQTIILFIDTAAAVVVQANTGQFIQIGNEISSSAGTATSSAQGATLTLVFRNTDTTWHSISVQGTWATA